MSLFFFPLKEPSLWFCTRSFSIFSISIFFFLIRARHHHPSSLFSFLFVILSYSFPFFFLLFFYFKTWVSFVSFLEFLRLSCFVRHNWESVVKIVDVDDYEELKEESERVPWQGKGRLLEAATVCYGLLQRLATVRGRGYPWHTKVNTHRTPHRLTQIFKCRYILILCESNEIKYLSYIYI